MKKTLKTKIVVILATLTCTFMALGLSSCSSSQNEAKLRINAPTETVEAELGSFTLPEYEVVTRDNLIDPRYNVRVVSVTDPDGEKVSVAFNKIQATKTGVYTVVYGSSKGIDNVTVKFDFADRLAPSLRIDVEKIPNLYCSGISYPLPEYTITDGPVLEKCSIKVMYQAEGATEREEMKIEDGKFEALYDSGMYYVVIHVEDAVGNKKDYEYKVSAFPGIKEEIPDKITYFDEMFGTTQATTYWAGPNKLKYNSSIHYGDENGSLEVTWESTQDWNYVLFSSPWEKDVSNYDYLEFYVYNPTEHVFTVEPGNSGYGFRCDPKEWTQVVLPISFFADGLVENMSNVKMSATNITNMALRFYGFNMMRGDSFNISAVYGRVGEIPSYLDDKAIIRRFEDRITSVETSSNSTVEIDNTVKFEDELGSMKWTRTGSGEMYASLVFPEQKNVSQYEYIVYNVYNPTKSDVSVGWKWCGDTVAKAGQWTEVRVPTSVIGEGRFVSGDNNKAMKADYLRHPCLRVISGLANGESLYIGGVYATIERPEGLYFEDAELQMLEGKTQQLSLMQDGVAVNAMTATWATSDANVATVVNGLVTAVKAGTVDITATLGSLEAKATITVSDRNTIMTFANADDLARTEMYWPDAHSLSLSTDQKYGEETGSLKVTWNQMQDWNYLRLKNPMLANVSAYDYVGVYVYNESNIEATLTFANGVNAYTLAPKAWTLVKFSTDFMKTGRATNVNTSIDVTNISGLEIKIFGYGFTKGESIYFSKFFGGMKASADESLVQDTVLVAPWANSKNNTQYFVETANCFEGAFSTAGQKDTNALGAYKVVLKKDDAMGYVKFNYPCTRDISDYRYLKMRVYNENNVKVQIQIGTSYVLLEKQGWNEIYIDMTKFDDGNSYTDGLLEENDSAFMTTGKPWSWVLFNPTDWNGQANPTYTNVNGIYFRVRYSEWNGSNTTLWFSNLYATNVAPTTAN